jgi:repressor LexA
MQRSLTKKQARILGHLRDQIRGGRIPTYEELGESLGITPSTAFTHLKALERKGKIRINRGRARGIELVDESTNARGRLVPILGAVSAGVPTIAEASPEGAIWVDERHVKGRQVFALRVEGDSMQGAGILHGDLVIAQRDVDAREGDIVVARIGPEVTVIASTLTLRQRPRKSQRPKPESP